MDVHSDEETYILLLLADSNLPTGSFVASSGLESYTTHGFLSLASDANPHHPASIKTDGTVAFVRDSLHAYAHSALPFSSDAHSIVSALLDVDQDGISDTQIERALALLIALDDLYESMTLNHVTRRASTAHGTALLTLYSRAFSPQSVPGSPLSKGPATLVDKLKLAVRRDGVHGHLPICWGVLTASLGLSPARSQHLALFLHARSLLSAAVRMNNIGPYLAQQILLSDIKPLVNSLVAESCHLRSGLDLEGGPIVANRESEGKTYSDHDMDEMGYATGPASTWPLGEIIAIRHDLQHSRIFNS